MKVKKLPQLILALNCVLCLCVFLYLVGGAFGSEAEGGIVTGPLLRLSSNGVTLFIAAFVAALFSRRLCAAATFCAAMLCIPFCIFLLAPVPIAEIMNPGGEFSVVQLPGIHWRDWRTMAVILLLVVTCVHSATDLVKSFKRPVR